MSASRRSDQNVDYYERHADQFAHEMLGLDMSAFYGPFLALVPPGGRVLDAGCGPGRDARQFKRRGYVVAAFDASPEMVKLASEVIGQPVALMRFQEMDFEGEFDGVWACASLLHVPAAEMEGVLARVARALRAGGACFMSFKEGQGEEDRGERRFTCHTEESLGRLLVGLGALEVVSIWRTADPRPGREGEMWVNALARAARLGPRTGSVRHNL